MRNFRDRHRNPGGPLAARRAGGGLTEITFPTAVTLTGTTGAGSWVTTPDADDLDLTGDLWIAARIAPAHWVPTDVSPTTIYCIACKEQSSSTRSYRFQLSPSGALNLTWSVNGSSTTPQSSSELAGATAGVSDAESTWVAGELDVDNGAGGYNVKFYTAADGPSFPTSWSQLGTTKTGGAPTSVFASTSKVEIGSRANNAVDWFDGDVYGVVIGSGSLAAPTRVAVFTAAGVSGGTYTDPYGHVWTVN